MIRLTKATANAVTVTTTEKGTATHYLFEFVNQMTRVKSYCIQEDTSPYEARYNQFEITETVTPTAVDGEVELNTGTYKYNIYGNTNATNLDPTGLVNFEMGVAEVIGVAFTPTQYSNNPTWTTYEG